MMITRDRLDRAAAMLDRVIWPSVARSPRTLSVEDAIALAFRLVDALPVDTFVSKGSRALN